LIILGSTGSIGVNALDICERESLEVECLCGGSNIALLNSQIQKFRPKIVCIADASKLNELNAHGAKVFCGDRGLLEALNACNGKLTLNAIVGFAGLAPTLECIRLGMNVALANKESLVVGGQFIDISKITPVDSEHFALWYLNKGTNIRKMTITASGGALRDTELFRIHASSVADVLKHPNWAMGRKITVDSATMVNKLFEIVEAYWLFGKEIEYDAIMETSSTIHAMIEFADGVTTAQMSEPDMRLPISYALTGRATPNMFKPVNLLSIGCLEFREIQTDRYPVWRLKDALISDPSTAIAVNAANEIAVLAFLNEQIAFGEIANMIFEVYNRFGAHKIAHLDDVFALDSEVREYARSIIKA
jgi:1-deoxy-D-xylulose-5-phosphate reductoisomerase